ncbi:MAG TPA: NAD(P)-binding domain-containing protein, partial [Ferruginibacter sp.]|nr:NAD(P)-binding domain-containing protein [Ferruginibacter sp.]
MSKRIAIIGGGNLGTAIAEGLLKSKYCKPADISITKRNVATLKALQDKGVHVTDNNSDAVKKSELVILAVKPFQVKDVLAGFQKVLMAKHLLISVVTGVTIKDIEDIIKKKIPVCRAMPNTAIAIQESMTCLSFNEAAGIHVNVVK